MTQDEIKAQQFAETIAKFQITANPTRFEHFFCNKDANDLCEFICNYINEDNYVQEDLQEAYKYFEKRDLIVGDELELENLLQTEYDDTLEVDDEEILTLQEELEAENENMNHYEKLLENICANNNEIDIQRLTGEIDKLVVTFNTATEENESLAQSLISNNFLLKQRISELIEEYNKISVPLIAHSIKAFENDYDHISGKLNSYLTCAFSRSSSDNNDKWNKKIMRLTLFDLKTCLTDSYEQEMITYCERSFLSAKNNALYRYDEITIPQDQLNDAISRLKLEELQLQQNITEDSLDSWCTKLVDKLIIDFYTKFNERNHRNLVSLKNQVDSVLENINDFRNLCKFLQFYLQHVIEAAVEHKSYCHGTFDDIDESDTKLSNAVIELNHLIQEYNGMDEKDIVSGNNFIQELARLINLGDKFEVTSLIQRSKDIEMELEKLHKSLFYEEYERFRENINPIVANFMSLFNNLQSSCTSQIMCWDSNVIQLIYQAEQIYIDELEKCRIFFIDFNSQKSNDSEKKAVNDRFFWVWFLKKPMKLLQFLKNIKKQNSRNPDNMLNQPYFN